MRNKYIVTWDNLQIFTKELLSKIFYLKKWKKIIAISRGGLVPASILSRELDIRYVDTLCISSYNVDKLTKTKMIKKSILDDSDDILIVDDLVDTGNTAKIIKDMYPKSYFVTIFAKPMGIRFVDNYAINVPQDVWIEQPWDMNFKYIKPMKFLKFTNKN